MTGYHWIFPTPEARVEVFVVELAADIVATASQYPAVRQARSFADLHAVYDANESVAAAARAVGVDALDDDANEAIGRVDEALRLGGWPALCELVDSEDGDPRTGALPDLDDALAAFEDEAAAALEAALERRGSPGVALVDCEGCGGCGYVDGGYAEVCPLCAGACLVVTEAAL